MLEKNLENCLNNAFKKAHSSNHEFVTTEHLLFCLLDNNEALKLLSACNVDIEKLTLEIWTDGSILPSDAVKNGADLLMKKYLSLIHI